MEKIAKISEIEREEIFRNTAQRMKVHPAIIEKDFWVCYILNYLLKILLTMSTTGTAITVDTTASALPLVAAIPTRMLITLSSGILRISANSFA